MGCEDTGMQHGGSPPGLHQCHLFLQAMPKEHLQQHVQPAAVSAVHLAREGAAPRPRGEERVQVSSQAGMVPWG